MLLATNWKREGFFLLAFLGEAAGPFVAFREEIAGGQLMVGLRVRCLSAYAPVGKTRAEKAVS